MRRCCGIEEERMNLQGYIEETYGITGEHLFAKYPGFLVFRHRSSRKLFAVIMQIPRGKLGLAGDGEIQVVNLKCDTRLIGSFREEAGIYPAYHMSKAHWLTVALDSTVEENKLRFLLEMSYDLTKGKKK